MKIQNKMGCGYIIIFLLSCWMSFIVTPVTAAEKVTYIGGIHYPKNFHYDNLAVDVVGRIYLSQRGSNRFQVYNKFGSHIDSLVVEGRPYFSRGGDFIVDKRGNILLVDATQNLLVKIDPDGKILFQAGSRGSGDGQFRMPCGVEINSEGILYIADMGNYRIVRYNDQGIYLGEISSGDNLTSGSENYRLVQDRYTGAAILKKPIIKAPMAVSINKDGDVFVLEGKQKFVFIYNSVNEYLGNIDLRAASDIQDIQPIDMSVEGDTIFIADTKYDNIKVFDIKGTYLHSIGSKGTGEGQFYLLKSVFSKNNLLYVLDAGNNRVQIFSYGEPSSKRIENTKEWTTHPTVGIFDFQDNKGPSLKAASKINGITISKMLTQALQISDNFKVMENKKLNKILEKLKFDSSSGFTKDTVSKIGKKSGLDVGITGTLSFLEKAVQIEANLLNMKNGIVITVVHKSVSNESQIQDAVTNMAVEMERAYLNRLRAPDSPKGIYPIPGHKSIYLRWEENREDNVVGYNIFQSDLSEGPYKKIDSVRKNEYTVNDLPDSAELYFKISALNSEGKESPLSPPAAGRTRKLPDFGQILKIKSETLPKKIAFSWSAPEKESVEAYLIYRSPDKNGDYSLVGKTTETSFSESGLDDGIEYFYKIRKVYSNGILSDYSNSFSCTTDARPLAVTELEAISDLTQKILIQWKARTEDKDILEYKIYRSDRAEGDFKLIKKLSARKRKYMDSKLKNNTTYYYKLKTIDKVGLESDFSVHCFATTKDIPPTPVSLTAEGNLPRKIKLTWSPNTDRENLTFSVYRSESASGSFVLLGKTQKPQYLDSNLPDAHQYFYFVSSKDKDSLISNPSEIVAATTKALPSAPKGVKAISKQPRKVTVVWDQNPEPDSDHYLIYFSEKFNKSFSKIGSTKQPIFVDDNNGKGRKNNTMYFYKITAVDMDGLESPYSETVQAVTKSQPSVPTNVVTEYQNQSLIVSWTPVTGTDIYGYEIYKNGKKISVEKNNLYVDKNIEKNKSYTYQITAMDTDQLVSEKSQKITFKIPE
ncbi:MAG: 6-bladed beta-propeller [Candidatus Aureabacteria bacterium]|nr:6-bladed beta-propeller [Candidatus Auribacterota bacterium]